MTMRTETPRLALTTSPCRAASAGGGGPRWTGGCRATTSWPPWPRRTWRASGNSGPQAVEAGLLPEPTEKIIQGMVADFKSRHRTGKVDVEQVRPYAQVVPKLGGNYDRYSCDNSSALSILDQLMNVLRKAQGENRFIPWAYIFSDYAVSGLDANRRGYMSYKAVLSDPKHLIETTYIDDFTRAGRAEIEWWRLAALSKRCNKRLIGASDGFDLSMVNSEVLITMLGLLSRLFIKGIREKVRRGMHGAARRGTVVGRLPLGFTRKVHRDANGNIVYRPDGRPRHEPCIDPETQKHRVLMFELFSAKRWSPYQIAKHFNDLKIDGWDGWTERGIKKLLVGLDAMGIFIWNRTYREYDEEQDKIVVKESQRSEWEVHVDPDLRLVPVEWWMDARRRLRKVWDKRGRKTPRPSRNQTSAPTLFSGTLVCGYCDAEILLVRSAGRYKQMGCLNGIQHAHDCKLSCSKSSKVIENVLLGFIRANLFSESVVEGVLKNANAYFEQEACKPRVDTAPLKAEARKLIANIRKYQGFIEEESDDTLCRSHNARVKELQARLNKVQAKIREADLQNRLPPKPLDLERGPAYVPDLREVLNQDIPRAAATIRTLTGPITITQEKIPGRRGARWIATFQPDVLALLREVARDKDYPEAESLTRATAPAEPVTVVIDEVPKYEELAPMFLEMERKGASVQSIASAYKMSWKYAKEILVFAKTGNRPKWKAGKRTGTGGKRAKYPDLEKRVTEMRDVQEMPFPAIAAHLNVGLGTVYRAYDAAHHEEVRKAAERGEKPNRGRSTRLGADKYQLIRKLLLEGNMDAEIAAEVGCGQSTVARTRRAMKAEADDDRAA